MRLRNWSRRPGVPVRSCGPISRTESYLKWALQATTSLSPEARMPNWVENTLQVMKGNPKEIFEFLHSDKSLVDFNKVVPMPEDIRALVDAQTPALVMPDGTKC